jgi:ATP-dependent RNA circularization protein (DNA/RNA ligase family)
MKKEYKAPLTEEIELIEHYGMMDVDHSGGEIGDKEDDYESKSTSTVMEDLSSESRKSVNLWSDDENKED